MTFRPRPQPKGIQAMTPFLGVAAQACLARAGLFRYPASFSLELVATGQSIRFHLVTQHTGLGELLGRELRVWHPEAEVSFEQPDYLPRTSVYALAELQQAGHTSLPTGSDLQVAEPLLSLLSALHELGNTELALLQILARPLTRLTFSPRLQRVLRSAVPTNHSSQAAKAATEAQASQPGFQVAIRLLVLAPSEPQARHHLGSLLTALAPFHGAYNRLHVARPPLDRLAVRLAIHERRFHLLGPTLKLSSEQVALLFHAPDLAPPLFPKLELMKGGVLLPPPINLPTDGLLLGLAPQGNQPIHLPHGSRLRHLLLLGPTGSGKTHTLCSFILQDIAQGRGCSLLTPSPDAITRILRRVPPEQRERIILVRFADPDWAFPLNPLAQEGVDSWRVASELVAIWERLYPQFWGPLVSDLFKHGVMALTEGGRLSSLLELVALLEDSQARQQLLSVMREPMLRRYWERFDDLAPGSQEARTRSSLNKIRAPLLVPWLRRTFSMRNSLSIRQVLDQRQVVLWDVSNLADEGRLLGALIVSQYYQAALSRADLPEAQRVPHVLYADEAWSWPTTTWAKGLDLLRQFGVGLVITSQRLDQFSEELRQAALANVGSAIVWGLRSEQDAVMMARWLATPSLEPKDIKHLRPFQTYARLLLSASPTPAFSLQMLPLPSEVPDADAQERAILQLSHQRYYRPAAEVDRELEGRHHRGASDPQSRPRRRPKAPLPPAP